MARAGPGLRSRQALSIEQLYLVQRGFRCLSASLPLAARKTSHELSREKGTIKLGRDWQLAQKDDASMKPALTY